MKTVKTQIANDLTKKDYLKMKNDNASALLNNTIELMNWAESTDLELPDGVFAYIENIYLIASQEWLKL